MTSRECRVCSKPLPPREKGKRGNSTVWCSLECKRLEIKQRNANSQKRMHKCDVCGVEFVKPRGNRRLCSAECRAKKVKEVSGKPARRLYRKANTWTIIDGRVYAGVWERLV